MNSNFPRQPNRGIPGDDQNGPLLNEGHWRAARYLLGEMDPVEAEVFEQELVADASAQHSLVVMSELWQGLNLAMPETPVPGAPQIPERVSGESGTGNRSRFLLWAIAGSILVVAVLGGFAWKLKGERGLKGGEPSPIASHSAELPAALAQSTLAESNHEDSLSKQDWELLFEAGFSDEDGFGGQDWFESRLEEGTVGDEQWASTSSEEDHADDGDWLLMAVIALEEAEAMEEVEALEY